jgi:hypothetical protein
MGTIIALILSHFISSKSKSYTIIRYEYSNFFLPNQPTFMKRPPHLNSRLLLSKTTIGQLLSTQGVNLQLLGLTTVPSIPEVVGTLPGPLNQLFTIHDRPYTILVFSYDIAGTLHLKKEIAPLSKYIAPLHGGPPPAHVYILVVKNGACKLAPAIGPNTPLAYD